MSLMNGVDSEEIIAGKIGSSHMLYSLIKVASSHKEGQGYVFNPDTTLGIIYGELNAPLTVKEYVWLRNCLKEVIYIFG